VTSRCKSCPVSLVCLAGQLKSKILLYCAKCNCLEVERKENVGTFRSQIGDRIPCAYEDASQMGVQLSICSHCHMAKKNQSRERRDRLRKWREENRDRRP
jgi:hypothetical protein